MNTQKNLVCIMFENNYFHEISIPTTPSIWIPSKNISKCYKCKDIFLYEKKHHYRICGRIFCSYCVKGIRS